MSKQICIKTNLYKLIFKSRITTHYTERQHSTFLILEKLFEIVIKNYGNKLSIYMHHHHTEERRNRTVADQNSEYSEYFTQESFDDVPFIRFLEKLWTAPPARLFRTNL